jgi:hypothetical protein
MIELSTIKLIFSAIDQALIASLKAEAVFDESPGPGKLVAISVPSEWIRTATDQVMVRGNLWIIYGASSYIDARNQGLVLSTQMSRVERDIRDGLKSYLPQSIQGTGLLFNQFQQGDFGGWNLELSANLNNAKQEAAWIVQIRPPFQLSLNDRLF